MKDAEVAQKMFERIGDNWDKETWRTRKYFDQCKVWAAYATKISQEIKAASLIVDQNLQTEEGREYDGKIGEEFAAKFADTMRKCVQETGRNLSNFDLLLQFGSRGQVETILSSHTSAVGPCLYGKLRETTFSSPPKPEYWVKIEMEIRP